MQMVKPNTNPDRPWLLGASNLYDPIGKPLGWAWVQERQAVIAEMIAEGLDPKSLEFSFEVTRRQEALHANDISMREAQRRKQAWDDARRPPPPPDNNLTKDEWQWLADHLAMGNDPVGQAIRNKALANLSE